MLSNLLAPAVYIKINEETPSALFCSKIERLFANRSPKLRPLINSVVQTQSYT